MRENIFIEQNKEKWQDFEELLKEKQRNPDKVSESFVEITDDLSYARTFYPNRSVRLYLNGIAQQIFRDVYKNKRVRWRKLIDFWTTDLPATMYMIRKDLLLAFLIFFGAFLIGIFQTVEDIDFVRVIFGDGYVEMTEENIANGDPMGVYKNSNEIEMFFRITFNNLRVALLSFVMGVFFCVGSIFVSMYNGIMLGSFQYFFYAKDVLIDSLFAVWLHGTLEISAIVISTAAGITMGKGLLFPGTLSRLEAFQMSARRGLKIMVGLAPIIILAGFIESFLTRYTEMPLFIRGALILISLAFMVGYFVIYPQILAKRNKIQLKGQKLPEKSEDSEFELFQIRGLGVILTESMMIHRRHFAPIFSVCVALLFPLSIGMYLLVFEDISNFDFPRDMQYRLKEYYLLVITGNYTESIPFIVAHALIWTVALTTPYYFFSEIIQQEARKITWSLKGFGKFLLKNGYKSLLIVLILKAIVFPSPYMILVALLFAPLFMFFLYAWTTQTNNPFKALGKSVKLFFFQPLNSFMMLFISLAVGFVYFVLINSGLSAFFIQAIEMHFIEGETFLQKIIQVVYFAGLISVTAFILPIFVYSIGIQYFSVMERAENTTLRKRIEAIVVEE
ncbi:stage II sporulation protein M [Bernardetia sp.]|uniref:stage II sporulation protein M n=1 Tax=Bernardetia sp. TaxID=1937974 RepID=UPI0025C4E01C|nr:stage II sporulation protein M [Bernardetia sp.]